MSMIKEEEFDYQAYTRTHPPDASKIQRGADARRQRFEAAQRRQVIRIDEDVLDEFRQLTPDAQDYERLINQALREWLSAQNVKELVREELHEIIRTAMTSMQPKKRTFPSKRKILRG